LTASLLGGDLCQVGVFAVYLCAQLATQRNLALNLCDGTSVAADALQHLLFLKAGDGHNVDCLGQRYAHFGLHRIGFCFVVQSLQPLFDTVGRLAPGVGGVAFKLGGNLLRFAQILGGLRLAGR
jgi:hypothetical protein